MPLRGGIHRTSSIPSGVAHTICIHNDVKILQILWSKRGWSEGLGGGVFIGIDGLREVARVHLVLGLGVMTSACTTAHRLPDLSDGAVSRANNILIEEEWRTSLVGVQEARLSEATFFDVGKEISPLAEQFCLERHSNDPLIDCHVKVWIDEDTPLPNAYQTYDWRGTPIVVFTRPLIDEVRTRDEIAFILSHEFGHHIAQHIGQGRGHLVGQRAYSQYNEFQADVIGAYLTLKAGYDPIRGARVLARLREYKETNAARINHPAATDRIALVIEAARLLSKDDRTSSP